MWLNGVSSRMACLAGGAALAAAVALTGCGDSGTKQITESRPVETTAQGPAQNAPQAPAPSGMQAQFTWTAPPTWKEQPATTMRIANFQVAGNPEAECYLTAIPGGGGGIEANVNRWRKQMSLPGYTPEEMAKLEKKKVLGKDAVYVDLDGTYQGMSGGENKQGYKMLGVILEDAGSAVFVKMTGPAAVVNQEKANFDAFCQSLKPGTGGSKFAARLPEGHPGLEDFQMPVGSEQKLPAGHPPMGDTQNMPQGGASAAGSSLTWQAPESWKRAGDKPMRLVTYSVGASGKSECYITILSGAAGGVANNINRWREQMGIETALDAKAIEALPKITVLGKPAPLVEIEGNFTGMDGQATNGYMLYGTVCDLGGETLFVKFVGPAADLKGEHDNFVAFCQSIAK